MKSIFKKEYPESYLVYLFILAFAYFLSIQVGSIIISDLNLIQKLLIGYLLAIISSFFFVQKFYSTIFKEADPDLFKEHKRIFPLWVGNLEQILYITAIMSKNTAFIGIWMGLKIAGVWKIWESAENRNPYNAFLVGNALSLINAFLWTIAIKPSLINAW